MLFCVGAPTSTTISGRSCPRYFAAQTARARSRHEAATRESMIRPTGAKRGNRAPVLLRVSSPTRDRSVLRLPRRWLRTPPTASPQRRARMRRHGTRPHQRRRERAMISREFRNASCEPLRCMALPDPRAHLAARRCDASASHARSVAKHAGEFVACCLLSVATHVFHKENKSWLTS
jgi:hypothetical protein